MELVGYTEEEERQIEEINGIEDQEALALAKEDFEARTGKEFPMDFRLNTNHMCLAMRDLRREVDPY